MTALGSEYLKGVGSEAGKTTWEGVKKLFGWTSDPAPDEIAEKTQQVLTESPDISAKLLELLRNNPTAESANLVQSLTVNAGGKVVIAEHIETLNM